MDSNSVFLHELFLVQLLGLSTEYKRHLCDSRCGFAHLDRTSRQGTKAGLNSSCSISVPRSTGRCEALLLFMINCMVDTRVLYSTVAQRQQTNQVLEENFKQTDLLKIMRRQSCMWDRQAEVKMLLCFWIVYNKNVFKQMRNICFIRLYGSLSER